MKVKTSNLTDRALDYATAVAKGATNLRYDTVTTYWVTLDGEDRALSSGWARSQCFTPSTDWSHGGPIIEREGIDLNFSNCEGTSGDMWDAACEAEKIFGGPTPLIAAMRCFVASKLGDEVDVPEELL